MLGHLGLHVDDLGAAKEWWDALAPLLGFEPAHDRPGQHGYRPADGRPGTWLFLYEAPTAGASSTRSGCSSTWPGSTPSSSS